MLCKVCHEEKPATEFYAKRKLVDGTPRLGDICRRCFKAAVSRSASRARAAGRKVLHYARRDTCATLYAMGIDFDRLNGPCPTEA